MKALWSCTRCAHEEIVDCTHAPGRCVHVHIADYEPVAAPIDVAGPREPGPLVLARQEQHDMRVKREYTEEEWKALTRAKARGIRV